MGKGRSLSTPVPAGSASGSRSTPDGPNQTRGGHAARAAVLLAAGLSVCAPSVLYGQQLLRRTVERTIPSLPPGIPIIVEGGAGSIRVEGSSRRSIDLRAIIEIGGPSTPHRMALLEGVRIEIIESNESVTVRAESSGSPGGGGGQDPRQPSPVVHYVLSVPSNQSLDLRSGAGAISVTDVGGEVLLESTAGDLTIRGSTGRVIAGSVNGSITVSGADAGVEVDTVSGRIILERVARRIRATCISGDITIRDSTASEVRASNTGGDITYEGAVATGGNYVLSSHSGNIRFIIAGEIGFEAQLSTFSGSISTPLEFMLSGNRTSRRSLTGSYLDPEATVTLTAFSGNITISRR